MKLQKKKLKEIIKAKNISIRALASKLGISCRTIYSWLNTTRMPGPSDVRVIAQILNVNPSEFSDVKEIFLSEQQFNISDEMDSLNKKFANKLTIEEKTHFMKLKSENERLCLDNKRLRKINIRQNLMLESLDEMVYAKDTNLKFTYVNHAFSSFFELEQEEVISKTYHALFKEEKIKKIVAIERAVLTSGKPVIKKEIILPNKESRKKYGFLSVKPTFAINGEIAGLICIITENTSFVISKERMSLIENAINGLNQSLWIVSATPVVEFIFCSDNSAKISGRTPSELYNCKVTWKDIIHPDDQENFINEILNSPLPHKIRHREVHKSGKILNVETEVYKSERTDSGKEIYYGVTSMIFGEVL